MARRDDKCECGHVLDAHRERDDRRAIRQGCALMACHCTAARGTVTASHASPVEPGTGDPFDC